MDSCTATVATEPVSWMARFAVWVTPVSGAEKLPTMEAALAEAEPTAPLASGKDTLSAEIGAAKAGAAVANVNTLAETKRVAIFLREPTPFYAYLRCCCLALCGNGLNVWRGSVGFSA